MTHPGDSPLGRVGAEIERVVRDLRALEGALRRGRPPLELQQIDRSAQELSALAAICRTLADPAGGTGPPAVDTKPSSLVGRVLHGRMDPPRGAGEVDLF